MKKFVIDRSKWLRGEGSDYSFLLRADKKMCCLGQICKQQGIPLKEMIQVTSPANMLLLFQNKVRFLTDNYNHTDLAVKAMKINDSKEIDDVARESHLVKLFQDNNIALEFVG
jgi:hypothetical protein